jgi:hypothetical protein
MSQSTKQVAPIYSDGGDEWAVGMPAYWLNLVPEAENTAEAEVLTRYYHVKPKKSKPGVVYDQRLVVRVGGTERAALAVVDFVLRYGISMGLFKTTRAIQIVQERMVRAWELAGRPGAV